MKKNNIHRKIIIKYIVMKKIYYNDINIDRTIKYVNDNGINKFIIVVKIIIII